MSAQALVECINQFALQDTNPVISILPDTGVVDFKQKYPQPMLSFSGMGLRAYYHCHDSDSQPENEHGHFHIFLQINDKQWSHLAGLSMDHMGQPLQWFTVNHWVTGETWNPADILGKQLIQLLNYERQNLEMVERWLLAMLEFYQQPINNLLIQRDQRIDELIQGKEFDSILKDRTIYDLSSDKINLLSDLESYASLTNY